MPMKMEVRMEVISRTTKTIPPPLGLGTAPPQTTLNFIEAAGEKKLELYQEQALINS